MVSITGLSLMETDGQVYHLLVESKHRVTPCFTCLTLFTVGMGKTIMLSALIHTNKEPEPIDGGRKGSTHGRQLRLDSAFRAIPPSQAGQPTKGPSATLVIAPTSLLSQWSDELERSSVPGSVRVVVWHGQNRLDLDGLEAEDDSDTGIPVVITSYGVLVSEHSKLEKSNGQSSVYQGNVQLPAIPGY